MCDRNNSVVRFSNISKDLKLFFDHWTDKILYVLTGKSNQVEQKQCFGESYRSKIIEFTKSDFQKNGKPNIIQTQIKQGSTSKKRYFHIPTYSADVPLHFSISIKSKTTRIV